MIKIYTYKNCSTCKKATKFLKENEIAFIETPIRETPPTRDELMKMLNTYNNDIKPLFNRSGQDYRKMNLKDKLDKLSLDEALQLLNQNGNLVKRPFLLSDQLNTVGFKEDFWKEHLH